MIIRIYKLLLKHILHKKRKFLLPPLACMCGDGVMSALVKTDQAVARQVSINTDYHMTGCLKNKLQDRVSQK